MFYEPQTLIIVYKDEMLANQMKKMCYGQAFL